jgi:hypothetical protein
VSGCTYEGSVKDHRQHHHVGRNVTAQQAGMTARSLSYVEDGAIKATPQLLARIHGAIDALIDEEAG